MLTVAADARELLSAIAVYSASGVLAAQNPSAPMSEPVNAEPDKCDELCWVDVNDLPENTIPYIKRALHNHLNRIKFDEFGW